MKNDADLTIDAIGKNCPLPVIYAKKAFEVLKPNQTVKLVCSDFKAGDDLKSLCLKFHHEFISSHIENDTLIVMLKKCAT